MAVICRNRATRYRPRKLEPGRDVLQFRGKEIQALRRLRLFVNAQKERQSKSNWDPVQGRASSIIREGGGENRADLLHMEKYAMQKPQEAVSDEGK